MIIGICGAPGTAKKTLASAYSDRVGMSFIPASATEVFKKNRLDPCKDHSLHTRLDIQEGLLSCFEEIWKTAAKENVEFVTDTTPIDLMAYALADIRREELTKELDERLQNYIDRCVNLTNTLFSFLMVVLPDATPVWENEKSGISKSHIQKISIMIMGLVASDNILIPNFYIPSRESSLERRIILLDSTVEKVYKAKSNFFKNSHITFH